MGLMQHIYNSKRHQIYVPQNPEKYTGEQPIISRSNWEFKFCRWLDLNSNVLKWASEPVKISYYDPTTRKKRNYFPDFFFLAKKVTGELEAHLIEIKPKKQAVKPRNSKKKTGQQLLEEQMLYAKNQAKWLAAQKWCSERGIIFNILTEKELFG